MTKRSIFGGAVAVILSSLLWVLSMPPFDFAEGAYIAFAPLLLWLASKPGWRWTLFLGFITGWASWFGILVWLRHVTWFGTFALSAILGLIFAAWLLAAGRVFAKVTERIFPVRIVSFLGLAALWVVLEWVRTWLFWGFPWAPLALSQWERPVVLQVAAWTGAYGVSFMLILFNLCVAQTLWIRIMQRGKKGWFGWFSLDLYVGLACLGGCIYLFFKVLPQSEGEKELFTASVVQPYIKPELKWDQSRELENMRIVRQQTQLAAALDSEVVLWPEAATPWPIIGFPEMQAAVEALSLEIGKPILMGNLAYDQPTEVWENGAFLVEPSSGLAENYYVKRELVPFGEYVPRPFRFIEKFVPVGGDATPGTGPNLIPLTVESGVYQIGSLVCYEDVFPRLARESVRAGAEVLFVATNNAWYGEAGGAPQHAAHSVLRAVENRRPVMRCGNAGWSGWIDAYGTIREVLTDAQGSVYFRGGGTYTVGQYDEWIRRQSFYTRHGDWFVGLCGGLAVLGGILLGRLKNQS